MSRARLYKDQRKRKEASRLLGQIYNSFTEGFDTPDLLEARALLQELSESFAN
jgi:predicted ATPase